MKKEKKPIRSEYIQIGVAVVILLLLTGALLYMIFSKKEYKVIVPNTPEIKEVNMGIVDFADNVSDKMDLNSKKTKSLSISYSVISDFYKNKIMLSSPVVTFENNQFLITNHYSSDTAYVSSISLDGKLNWLYVIDESDYDKVNVYKVLSTNDSVYALCSATKDKKTSLIGIKINNEGKKVLTKVIKDNTSYTIADAAMADDGIVLASKTPKDFMVDYLSFDLDSKKNFTLSNSGLLSLGDYDYIQFCALDCSKQTVHIMFKKLPNPYKLDLKIPSFEAEIKEMDITDDDGVIKSISARGYLNGFVLINDTSLYKVDESGSLINKMNYKKVKLEDIAEYKKAYKNVKYSEEYEGDENFIQISNVYSDKEKIMVAGNTAVTYFYDIYDEKLDIKKRYVVPTAEYFVENGVILKAFYINDKIYEVYAFGNETPSIMISTIG